jgi:hypothetical protein
MLRKPCTLFLLVLVLSPFTAPFRTYPTSQLCSPFENSAAIAPSDVTLEDASDALVVQGVRLDHVTLLSSMTPSVADSLMPAPGAACSIEPLQPVHTPSRPPILRI